MRPPTWPSSSTATTASADLTEARPGRESATCTGSPHAPELGGRNPVDGRQAVLQWPARHESDDVPMTPNASRRSRAVRPGVAIVLAVALVSSCSATDRLPGGAADAPETTSVTTSPSPSTTTIAPVPPAELPPVPTPMALTGTPTEQAAALAEALADPAADRLAVALAAFEAAGLPVLLADGTSLTSTTDPVGLPWSVVASAASLSGPTARVSLTELTRLLSMVNPSAAFDPAAAADETAAAMRAELTAPTAPGPAFVAELVAAESRRYDGTELADPAVTGDQLHVSTTTALLIGAGVMRALTSQLIQSGVTGEESTTSDTANFQNGPARTTHSSSRSASLGSRPAQGDLSNGCDDGMGGWGLWVGSKLATGFTFGPQLGIEWNGFYKQLAVLGEARGFGDDMLKFTDGFNTVSAMTFAVVNVAIFLAQVAGRNASAVMDGTGPLVRTKKTDENGSARKVTLTIDYDDGAPEVKNARNCILAAMAALGNNAQLPTGPAADVIVATSGATGFASGLAAGDSYVMFGPDTFHIEQTTDADGRIVVPVQGRRQRIDKTDSTTTVSKEFGIFFEAALDPTGASQIARAFADDALCLGAAATGQAGTAIAECQNALIDIIKQFRWDIGEFMFPLQDWENSGWLVEGFIYPYEITGIKCDGIGGPWFLNFVAQLDGGTADGVIEGDMDEATGTGLFVLDGIATGSGVSIPIHGEATASFVQTGEDTAQLVIAGTVNGGGIGGGTLSLTRTSCE